MECPYCAQSNTHKDVYGYCKKYECKQRMENEQLRIKQNRFNSFSDISTRERVETIKTYNYGKLVKTEIIRNYL